MNLNPLSYFTIAAVLAGTLVPQAGRADQTVDRQTLVDELRQGGYVIVMRHAMTDVRPDDAQVDLTNCATQRNLTIAGREAARSIGRAIAGLNIPIGLVLSSPFCRTFDTATLAFGHAVTIDGLGEKSPRNATTAAEAASTLRPLIATAWPPGTNVVVVTHGFNIKSVVGGDFAEGEAAILRADGNGGFELVARLLPQDWTTLQRLQSNHTSGLDVHIQPIDPAGDIQQPNDMGGP